MASIGGEVLRIMRSEAWEPRSPPRLTGHRALPRAILFFPWVSNVTLQRALHYLGEQGVRPVGGKRVFFWETAHPSLISALSLSDAERLTLHIRVSFSRHRMFPTHFTLGLFSRALKDLSPQPNRIATYYQSLSSYFTRNQPGRLSLRGNAFLCLMSHWLRSGKTGFGSENSNSS